LSVQAEIPIAVTKTKLDAMIYNLNFFIIVIFNN
jgi:hypothetical protein